LVLDVEEINVFYGLSHVLFGVSLMVNNGEIACLLGRNGAGKSTTLKAIMGSVVPQTGSIRFEGGEIISMPPYTIARLGIGYVPQGGRIFADLTIRENLQVAARGPGALHKVYDLFPILKNRSIEKGEHLSGGERQMLSVGRVLMGNPKLLLLDEPCMGLAPLVARQLVKQVGLLREAGMSILLVEQTVGSAVEVADRCYILERGKIRYEASSEMLMQDRLTIRRRLGV
jgi:branched-chain amino acid transport system ATP-binding protein